MTSARDVNPQKWSEKIELYDNEVYSVVWGRYDGEWTLGVRWNGNDGDDIGFPRQGNYPTFYVEPDFLWEPILLSLLKKVSSDQNLRGRYLNDLIDVLRVIQEREALINQTTV